MGVQWETGRGTAGVQAAVVRGRRLRDNRGMSDAHLLFLQRLASPAWQHPGFAPYWPILRRLRRLAGVPPGSEGQLTPTGPDPLAGWDTACWVDLFNQLARWRGLRSAAGVPLRFVAGSDEGAVDYEQRILRHGEIPCKVSAAGARHDFHNALVWLRFPRLKACFNLLHCQAAPGVWPALEAPPGAPAALHGSTRPGRGHRRDALTLLDENGALWPGPAADWVQALRERRWQALFVDGRGALLAARAPVVIGHGLLEKLHRPYKSMTAKLLPCPAGGQGLDRQAAAQVQAMAADDSLRPSALLPLPLQGWPAWDAANADPAFYDDPQVFRALPVRAAAGHRRASA